MKRAWNLIMVTYALGEGKEAHPLILNHQEDREFLRGKFRGK